MNKVCESLLADLSLSSTENDFHQLKQYLLATQLISQLTLNCTNINRYYQSLERILSKGFAIKTFAVLQICEMTELVEVAYEKENNSIHCDSLFTLEELNMPPLNQMWLDNVTVVTPHPDPTIHIFNLSAHADDASALIIKIEQSNKLLAALFSFCAQQILLVKNIIKKDQSNDKNSVLEIQNLKQQIREQENSELLQESLLHISELSSKNLTEYTFYNQVRNIIGQLFSSSNFYVAKLDQNKQVIEFVYFVDQFMEDGGESMAGVQRQCSNSLTDYVINQSKVVLLGRQEIEELHDQGIIQKSGVYCTSWLGVPLISEGITIGVIAVQSYNSEIIFTDKDADILKFVSHHVSMAIKKRENLEYKERVKEILEQKVQKRTRELKQEIERRQLIEKKLQYSASHDALTKLPNRAYFLESLGQAIKTRIADQSRHFAVLFLDLDRFKMVNDNLGHHVGDILLQLVASDLNSMVRESDMVARLGGDEFVLLLNNIDNNTEASDVAKRITSQLSQPYVIEQQEVKIGASIGILYGADRYSDALVMLRDADTALYQAKGAGKGCFEIFDMRMHQEMQDAFVLEADLRTAVEHQQFEPYFQPIVDLNTNRIVGFEALARWKCPKRGTVFPDGFITKAEESGIICTIDLQILEKAIAQLKQWQDNFSDSELYISSNFDYTQFFDQSMPGIVESMLLKSDVRPSCLLLELTERGLLENSDLVQNNMQALKNIGIRLALDDFGTGYSSLSYLYRYPIDILKIDRSFVLNIEQNPSNKAIVKTIIDLASNLNMKTIAEGIENQYEANYLNLVKSSFGQGYHFSKPVCASEAFALLQEQYYESIEIE